MWQTIRRIIGSVLLVRSFVKHNLMLSIGIMGMMMIPAGAISAESMAPPHLFFDPHEPHLARPLSDKNRQILEKNSLAEGKALKHASTVNPATPTTQNKNLIGDEHETAAADLSLLAVHHLDKEPHDSLSHPIPKRAEHKTAHTIVIVLDPGHGGKDPGAGGSHESMIQEKTVVFQIAKKLQYLLNQHPPIKAVLTRRGDYYIGLRERLQIARKNKANLFIAIHADAFNNPFSHGASIFALSPRGATSEAARWLAERENYSELGGVHLADKNEVLRSVLLDLSQTATINNSLELGDGILKNLQPIAHLHNRRVEQARFVVLKSPDIPSILIETGFISNFSEALKLQDDEYQQQLAMAIFKGIQSYFWHHPMIYLG